MFFGLCNSPAMFQSMMDSIFKDLIEGCIVIIYMDNIFLFAKTPLELENNTKQVLQRLKENDLFLKLGKCEFCKTKIEWLGMVIEEGRISMDPGKLKGISKWPSPATAKTNLGFPQIRKLLPKIHPSLLRNCQTPQRSSKERQKI